MTSEPFSLAPDSNVPFLFGTSMDDLRDFKERFAVAEATIDRIKNYGGEQPSKPTDVDVARAESTFMGIQEGRIDPKTLTFKTFLTPMGKVLGELLRTYEEDVIESATQLRVYTTNRLLEESNSQNPQIRIKALELIGKITDVGLFTERSENVTTIRHIGDDELDKRLKELLDSKVVEVNEKEE